MKTVSIITAKIDSKIWPLIRDGKKHYEVRTTPFRGAHFIHYVDSIHGYNLGTFALGASYLIDRSEINCGDIPREFAFTLSGVTREEFDTFFLRDRTTFYVAHILQQVTELNDIFAEEAEQ
ncbi:hypothetical protein BPY_01080 [Bifidobacterium psychraerophilum]|uniref:hypothetical protein n=1 Tax=Bifidobacterium psychraerophilum TaxID=218140 RepID=UPI0031132974